MADQDKGLLIAPEYAGLRSDVKLARVFMTAQEEKPMTQYLSVSKFAKRFSYSPEYVRQLIRAKVIVAVKFTDNGNWKIPLSQPFTMQRRDN